MRLENTLSFFSKFCMNQIKQYVSCLVLGGLMPLKMLTAFGSARILSVIHQKQRAFYLESALFLLQTNKLTKFHWRKITTLLKVLTKIKR